MRASQLIFLLASTASSLRVPAIIATRRQAVRTLLAAPLVGAPLATQAGLAPAVLDAAGIDLTKKAPAAKPADVTLSAADQRFMELIADDLAAREKKFGFALDDESKATFETMLRNKYCGPQGLSSGWGLPGGPCTASDGCALDSYGSSGACNRMSKGLFAKPENKKKKS